MRTFPVRPFEILKTRFLFVWLMNRFFKVATIWLALFPAAFFPARGQNPPLPPLPPPPPVPVAAAAAAQPGDGSYDFREPLPPGSSPMIDLRGPEAPVPTDAIDSGAPVNPPPPAKEKATELANGVRIGEKTINARIVEEEQVERSMVYPDDPESAWWETNVRYAFGRAQREMRPLLLLFTATWSEPAMQLSMEVFATKSFNEYVKQNLVICFLAYPKNITDAPPSMKWAKEQFKVAGYPSVLIFNPKGEVVRSLRSYRKGRPVDYFNELKQVCAPVLAQIEQEKHHLASTGYRFWRNPEGRSLFAKFVRRDDLLMTLKDANGQDWTIAINQLSEEDRRMANSFPRLDEVLRLQPPAPPGPSGNP